MKIFYVTSVIGDWGGSEIYTRDLLKELMKRGHELCVCTTENYDLQGATMVHLPSFLHHGLHKFTAPFFYGRALKAAREFKPDIIQSHSNSCMGLIGHYLKRDLKLPHTMLMELIASESKSWHIKFVYQMEKLMLPRLNYDKLFIWTENIKNRYLIPWGIKESRIIVMPAALNIGNYDPSVDGTEINKRYGTHLITSAKTLWGMNAAGLKYIIEAMRFVAEKHPEYRYVIFGNGPERKNLEEFVRQKSLEKNVLIAGPVSEEDKKKMWAATEISPHSFVYEFSTSISLLEYMAMGKPCVVTDVGAVREFVKDAALVVKAESPEAIAQGIIELIENPKKAKALGEKARKLVEEKYSIEASASLLEKTYMELKNNA